MVLPAMNPMFGSAAAFLLILLYIPSMNAAGAPVDPGPGGPPADSPAILQSIMVRGNVLDSWLAPDNATALERLQDRSGNTSLVKETGYQDGAVLGLRDALSRTPGVYVQNAAGQESVKLSIRGSGLASPIGVRGVRLLRDGLSLSRADGIVDPSYADPFNVAYMEIYRGASALEYGAATLGGAINLVSPTGYSHQGAEIRTEAGSDGYLRAQGRAGRVFENDMDAFVSVSNAQTNGSAYNARQAVSRFYGNLGFQQGARSEGRFHINLERHAQQASNPITLSRLLDTGQRRREPTVGLDRKITTRPHNRVSYQHLFRFNDNDSLSLGAYYARTGFLITGNDVNLSYDARDYGASLRGELNRTFAGRENRFIWGATMGVGHSHNSTFGPMTLYATSNPDSFDPLFILVRNPATFPPDRLLRLNDDSGDQYEDIHTGRTTTELFAENSFNVAPTLKLIAGAQAVFARRRVRIDLLQNPAGIPFKVFGDVDRAASYSGISPRAGVLWQISKNVQAFANVSRSFEPPTETEFYNSRGTLAAQRAVTVEIGARGQSADLNWQVALYRSRVKDEILKQETRGRFDASENIDATTHTGLELGAYGKWAPGALPGMLDWGVAYTWNRFRIADHSGFAGHTLPGIPNHMARIDVVYRHPSGAYWGPNVELASGRYVDQANTLKAPGYGIVNFTLGYEAPNSAYRLFLDARNLQNKRYAASTQYVVDARGKDGPYFDPGLQRALFAGAHLRW